MKRLAMLTLALGSLVGSATRADDSTAILPATDTALAADASHAGRTPLSTLPLQNVAAQWAAGLHVPEFLGTATAFAMMTWALRTRRIV